MKMKNIYIFIVMAAAALACREMDELEPQGGIILSDQLQEVNTVIPSRADAAFNGLFTKMGAPGSVLGGSRPDDFGFVMMAFSNDVEAADIVLANSGYNWFSVCGALTSRNADYANPYIRYADGCKGWLYTAQYHNRSTFTFNRHRLYIRKRNWPVVHLPRGYPVCFCS